MGSNGEDLYNVNVDLFVGNFFSGGGAFALNPLPSILHVGGKLPFMDTSTFSLNIF